MPLNSLIDCYVVGMLSEFHFISGLGGTETSNVIIINILHWENPLHFFDLIIPSPQSEYNNIPFDSERLPSNNTHLVTFIKVGG